MSKFVSFLIGLIFIAIGVYIGNEITRRRGLDKYERVGNVWVSVGIAGTIWGLLHLWMIHLGVITD